MCTARMFGFVMLAVAQGLRLNAKESKQRIGVCFTGFLREFSYEDVRTNLLERFLTPLQRDHEVRVFFVTSGRDQIPVIHGYPEVEIPPAGIDALLNAFSPAAVKIVDPPPGGEALNTNCTVETKQGWDYERVEKWVGQWRKVKDCFDLVKAHEKDTGNTFDYLIRLRTDMVFIGDINPRSFLDSSAIVIPRGIVRGGWNDHMAVCPRGLCDAYFSIVDDYEQCSGEYKASAGYGMGHGAGSELMEARLRFLETKHRMEDVKYTIMRPCDESSKVVGLDCSRYEETFHDSKTCEDLSQSICRKVAAARQATKQRFAIAASTTRETGTGDYFSLIACDPNPSQTTNMTPHAYHDREYAPLKCEDNINNLAMLICSLKKVSARRMFVLASGLSDKATHQLETLGASIVNVSGFDTQAIWLPTFPKEGSQLPQARTDGYLTYKKFSAFNTTRNSLGVFIDADTLVLNSDVEKLFDLDMTEVPFRAEVVERSFPFTRYGWQSSICVFKTGPQYFAQLVKTAATQKYHAFTNTDQDVFDGAFPATPSLTLPPNVLEARWHHHHVGEGIFKDPKMRKYFSDLKLDDVSPECKAFAEDKLRKEV